MKWNNIKITIFKELRGIIRDKKSLQKLILYPLLIPFIILLFGVLFDGVSETEYVVGTNYQLSQEEKNILKELDNIKIKSYNSKEEVEKGYENDEITGYIIKDNNEYTIYADESQNSGEIIMSIASSYLESYNQVLGNQYLIENGVDPSKVFNTITVKTKSLTKSDNNMMTTMIFSLVFTYIIMIVVMACVIVVIDATSGEKERGTLETILTFPVKSGELVVGKYLATSILGFIIGVVSYLLSIPTITIGKKLFESYEELTFIIDAKTVALVIFIVFLAALLSAGVCMALAGKAKTFKEAQSSLQFVTLLPMIPYFLTFMEKESAIVNLIPIANCGTLLNNIIINNIEFKSLLIIVLSTIVYIVLILIYISKQYKKEETLFS